MKKMVLFIISIVSLNWLNVVRFKCIVWLLMGGCVLFENYLVYILYLEIVIFYSMYRYYENK